jgi:hypothetical protein
MNITVKLGGPLREKVPGHVGGELRLKVDIATWICDVIEMLGLDCNEVALVMLNGRPLAQDKLLCHSDRVALFPRAMVFNTLTAAGFHNPLKKPGTEAD